MSIPSAQGPLAIDARAFDGRMEKFQPRADHLVMSTPYRPIAELREELERRIGARLVQRGEAHVTVMTPPEFETIRGLVSMNEIDELACRMGLQSARLEPVCLGRGEAKLGGKLEQTYFIVVRSEDLLKIRRAIRSLYVDRQTESAAASEALIFDPEAYHPHITVGFTKVDLHIRQGVVKDAGSCFLPLNVYLGPAAR